MDDGNAVMMLHVVRGSRVVIVNYIGLRCLLAMVGTVVTRVVTMVVFRIRMLTLLAVFRSLVLCCVTLASLVLVVWTCCTVFGAVLKVSRLVVLLNDEMIVLASLLCEGVNCVLVWVVAWVVIYGMVIRFSRSVTLSVILVLGMS